MRRQRAIWAAVALAMAGVPTAEADDLKNMLQQKFQLAEIFEGAAYAAEKCPGLRVIEGNIMATADEAGVTIHLQFKVESEAIAFAHAFSGQLL